MTAQATDSPEVLIPRPRRQAEAFAAALEAAAPGRWRPVIAPLIRIVPRDPGPLPDRATDLLFTSANGVEAFAALSDRRDLDCVCVGAATAQAAQRAGFAPIVLGPDAAAMAQALSARAPRQGRTYLHLHGEHLAHDIVGALTAAGHSALGAVCYEQQPQRLPPAIRDRLRTGAIGAVALFSARSARLLADALDPLPRNTRLHAYCLSAQVADATTASLGARVSIADQPDRDGMLRLLGAAMRP